MAKRNGKQPGSAIVGLIAIKKQLDKTIKDATDAEVPKGIRDGLAEVRDELWKHIVETETAVNAQTR